MAGEKSTLFITDLLNLVFQGTAIPLLAANAAAPTQNLYLALHTADPTASGTQATSEAAYTSYKRVAIARTSAGFTVSGAVATLASTQSFPAATGGSETETYFSVGTTASGSGATVTFTVSGGVINAVTATPAAGGTGYPASASNLLLYVSSGGGTGGIVSATTNSSGVVTAFATSPILGGTGYSGTTGASTGTSNSTFLPAILLYTGPLSPTIVVSSGVTPQILATTTTVTEA